MVGQDVLPFSKYWEKGVGSVRDEGCQFTLSWNHPKVLRKKSSR